MRWPTRIESANRCPGLDRGSGICVGRPCERRLIGSRLGPSLSSQ
ncbi:hypothetical protein [Lysobacter gummosus]